MTDPSSDADERSTARPGARRPSTLQGMGTAEELMAEEASLLEKDREMQVRSLADLAAESHLAVTAGSSARGALPEPSRAADPSPQPPDPDKDKEKETTPSKPAPLTLGPAKRAVHNFDSMRRPTAGKEERVASKGSRQSRRRKPARKQPVDSGLARGGVREENAPLRDRLRRLSDGEFKPRSEQPDPADAPADESPAAQTRASNTKSTKPPPADARAGLPNAGPRRERRDEKTRRHVYDDRDLASSAKPTGRSGPDHPVVEGAAQDASAPWGSAVVEANSSEGDPSEEATAHSGSESLSTTIQPETIQPQTASADTAHAAQPAASARLGRPRRLGPSGTAATDLRANDDTPILALSSPSAALPGTPATPSQPVPRSESGLARWMPVFLASALGAFIAVALYWTAFDAGASSRAVLPTPRPTVATPTPLPAAAPVAPSPPPEPEPIPVAEPAVASEAGPLDLGEIPEAIAALSALERQQLAQDLRIRARSLNRTRQYRRAEQIWRLSLQHDPTNAPAAHGLAETLLATDQADAAMGWARRATELDPDDAGHEELLGDALLAVDELEGAVEAYQRALVIDPDARGARIRLSRVRRRIAADP